MSVTCQSAFSIWLKSESMLWPAPPSIEVKNSPSLKVSEPVWPALGQAQFLEARCRRWLPRA